jgi:pimeloyl-ACP methyl ester carboxylesterase
MDIAHLHGVDIHYQATGEGPPVLLVMGMGARGDAWTLFSQALAGAGYRAIQYDNRDSGWSSVMTGKSYEISDMANDALGLLDHLGIPEAYLIGISMGGMICQELLLTAPGRFKRAVLMATSPGGPSSVPPQPDVIAALNVQGDITAESLRSTYTAITAPGFVKANASLTNLTVQLALQKTLPVDAMLRQMAATLRWTSWGRLDRIKTRTLIIHGDADPLIPRENAVLLAGRIPGARLRIIPCVGHLIPVEAPMVTMQAVLGFLSEP